MRQIMHHVSASPFLSVHTHVLHITIMDDRAIVDNGFTSSIIAEVGIKIEKGSGKTESPPAGFSSG
jgi:hypothetical protein